MVKMIKTDKQIFDETFERLEKFESDPDIESELDILKEMADELLPGPRKDFFQRIHEKMNLAEEKTSIDDDSDDFVIEDPEGVMGFYKEALDIVTDTTQLPSGIPIGILEIYIDILTGCIDMFKDLIETFSTE